MTSKNRQIKHPASSDVPAFIYEAIVILTVWLVLSAWTFGLGGGYVDLSLAMVTVFFIIATAIPFLLWRIWRREQGSDSGDSNSFRDWTSGDMEIWQGRLKGTEAAVQILLPIAAVSLGMTTFAVVFYLVARGA